MIQQLYNHTIRPYLPRKLAVCNGVTTRRVRLLDTTDHHPNYKQGLVDAIHDHVTTGDSVTIVGAGWGISTVHCLEQGADVTAIEAAREQIEIYYETLELNGYQPSDVTLVHALVGPAIDVYGDSSNAKVIDPGVWEHGSDVLVLDCEGAEREILRSLGEDRMPSTVICETHPEFGVDTSFTLPWLTNRGLTVDEREYMPGDDRGKHVLVGTR